MGCIKSLQWVVYQERRTEYNEALMHSAHKSGALEAWACCISKG